MFWAESWPSVRDHLRNRKWDFNKGRIGVAQFENRRWSLIARFALSTSGHNHLHWIHSTAKIFTEASTVQTKWNQEMRKYGRLVLYYWLHRPFSWGWRSYRDKKKKTGLFDQRTVPLKFLFTKEFPKSFKKPRIISCNEMKPQVALGFQTSL